MRKRFSYTGRNQAMISFPMGGLGSGCVGIAGNGRLIDWEIFNRPNKGSYNGFSHFSIKVEDDKDVLGVKVLNGDLLPPYMGSYGRDYFYDGFGFGIERESCAGLPHFVKNTFKGTFPIAKLGFKEKGFPAEVEMEAFNPFIPQNDKDSSIPAAFFKFVIKNPTDKPLTYYLNGVLGNPYKGATRNRFGKQGNMSYLVMDSVDMDPESVANGNLCIATDSDDVSYQEYFYRGEGFDGLEVYWNDINKFGPFQNRHYEPEDYFYRDNGLVSSRIVIEPGKKQEIRYVISWSNPINRNTWGRMGAGHNKLTEEERKYNEQPWKNYYATIWPTSIDSAVYSLENWNYLYDKTRRFRDILFDSSLPECVLDAVSANISILKSPTVWRLEDGTFYGWEGCGTHGGSCEGSCLHVWGYAQALPFLFPNLSRSMREAEYKYNWGEDGGLTFRMMLPLGGKRWNFRPCADGQFVTIMKVYRDWKISGDNEWLKEIWPRVKASLEYAWNPENTDLWDPEKKGILTGMQHQTLDMDTFGPNAWLSGMYLGALKGSAEMARAMGEPDSADEYMEIFERGCKYLNSELFNGEYYIQKIDLSDKDILKPFENSTFFRWADDVYDLYWSDEHQQLKYQIGEGLSIDQLLGQWHADVYGIGDIFDREQAKTALKSEFKYNYCSPMRDYYNPCRLYCLNDEGGLVITAWPKGADKPVIPVSYSQETMHGFEYSAADLMIRRGLEDEGLTVIKSLRDRYDGERRNPWNEQECGSNYARSMASYALLLTYSGFEFDATKNHIGFHPLKDDASSFMWSFSTGWGEVERKDKEICFSVADGNLALRSFGLDVADVESCELNGEKVEFSVDNGNVVFANEILLNADDQLVFKY